MKNLYLMVFLLICGSTAFGQSRNNHWLLGLTDVNFSTNPPVANVVTGGASTKYGIATISDTSGALLFYTDGVTVWNKNHQIMQNGDLMDISTDPSTSLQKVIIVPHPGNSNRYYIVRHKESVVLDDYDSGTGYYAYSIVDFSSNNLGQVLPFNETPWTLEFTNEYTSVLCYSGGGPVSHSSDYSPLTFTADSTGNNYWIIVQDQNNLLSFKVDSQGLSATPVVSTFPANQIFNGPLFNSGWNGRFIQRSMFRVLPVLGTSKLYGLESSKERFPDDTDPGNHSSHFYSVDFNMTTGQFTNYQDIQLQSSGVEFNFEISPDLTKAYFVAYFSRNMTGGNDGQIIVKDLSNLSSPTRILYEFVGSTTPSAKFYNIQKDRYGNMFVTGKSSDLSRDKYLHIINNPNSFSGSTVKINHLYLNNNTANELPQLFPKIECMEFMYLNTTETANKTYKVSSFITTNINYIVNSGVTINLKAENAIFLEPNTDIKDGAVLYADIEVCSNSSTDRINTFSDDAQYYEEIQGTTFAMYPNPSDNITTFSLTDDVIKSISIYSLDGRTVFSRDIMQNEYALDVKDYPKGIYIATVTTLKGETLSKKLVKN